jgi:branched-chain amino acid transport system substrate-binding protein
VRARRTVAGAAAVGLALVTGCGTQVDDARIEAVGNGYNAPAVVDAAGTAAGTTQTTGTAAEAPTGPVAATTTAAGGTAVSAPTVAVPAAPKGGTKSTTRTSSAPVDVAAQPCMHQLAPIVLGQTLATSGLLGSTVGNTRAGLAIWAKAVNARGGLYCHPVQVTSLDDGSDSAKVASNWNALKQRGMVAMLGAAEPISMGALRVSAERDHIPVIGGDLVDLAWFQSPWLFPQGSHPFSTFDGSLVEAAKARPGAKVAGLVYCVEASICTGIKNNFGHSAQLAHLSVGLMKAVSLTQSDFTAECQAMKAAHVDVLWLALDGSGNTRLARSCEALGYHPQLATNALGAPPAVAEDPLLRQRSLYLAAPTVPFSTRDTPGAAEFGAAMAQFAPGFKLDQSVMQGWSSGKLLEAALAKVAVQARAGDVTTALILRGLQQLKNETMNGLGPGVTFSQNKPATVPRCYYVLLLSTEGVIAPLGSKLRCLAE